MRIDNYWTPSELEFAYGHYVLASIFYSGLSFDHLFGIIAGVYASTNFKEGELLLKDQMLVGAQHSSNKVLEILCSLFVPLFHFLLLSNILRQRKWSLKYTIITLQIDCFVCSFCFRFIGSIELQIGRRLYLQNLGDSISHGCSETDSSDEDDKNCMQSHDDLGRCGSSNSRYKIPLPKGVVDSLMNAELVLPYSSQFSLPAPVPCSGGCGEAYYCR